jgi:hypothetical protein
MLVLLLCMSIMPGVQAIAFQWLCSGRCSGVRLRDMRGSKEEERPADPYGLAKDAEEYSKNIGGSKKKLV